MDMRKIVNLTSVTLLGLLLVGCNGESPTLDDPDDANSVLEVMTMTIPDAQLSGSVSDQTCTLTIADVGVTLRNKAKSEPAEAQPFNDIILQYVTIHYTWDDPTIVTADRTWSLGGTVPAEAQGTVSFAPIALVDADAAMQGHTANLFMTFHGVAASGEPVTATGGGTWGVGGTCEP
jgi:type 1 fimbria pilin